MKKSTIIIVALIAIGGLFILIKKNGLPPFIQSLIQQDSASNIIQENQNLIDRVINLCANTDDDINTFATKAWSILEDQTKWAQKHNNILKQQPELAAQIDKQWTEALYTLGSSIEQDANDLQKQKKAFAIEMIGSKIKPETLIEYLQNKPGINQEALTNYLKK